MLISMGVSLDGNDLFSFDAIFFSVCTGLHNCDLCY